MMVVARTKELAAEAGTSITMTANPVKAVSGADIVVTDTWVSMGQEEEAKRRIAAFEGYQVTEALMAHANDNAIFMHCLPRYPEEVDETRCRALMWNRGFGKLQCCNPVPRGQELCRVHTQAPHGKVRGPIPEQKLNEFRKRALKPGKDSKQWYARHLMWAYASKMSPMLEYLNEVDDRGQYKLSDMQYEQCLKQM